MSSQPGHQEQERLELLVLDLMHFSQPLACIQGTKAKYQVNFAQKLIIKENKDLKN